MSDKELSDDDELRRRLLGLGEGSFRKSYYPELQEKIRELEYLNRSLESRVESRTEELRRNMEQLERAKIRLVEAEQAALLSRVIGGIAHELNTPLGNAYTAGSFLERMLKEAEEERPGAGQKGDRSRLRRASEAAALLNSSLERAIRIMERFRALSPAEGSSRMRRTRLSDLVGECLESLESQLRQLTVRVDIPEDIYLRTDPSLFLRILSALIENTVDHGRPSSGSGAIRISAETDASSVRIRFEDNGPGVRSDLEDHLFDPFVKARAPGGTGSGLGLFMVQSLVVRSLGGTVSYRRSRGLGGSEFLISLPAGDALAPGHGGDV